MNKTDASVRFFQLVKLYIQSIHLLITNFDPLVTLFTCSLYFEPVLIFQIRLGKG